MSTWKVILATLVIFCTGFFAGVLFPRRGPQSFSLKPPLAAPSPLPNERRIEALRRFTEDLQLTEDQKERIEAHIQESQERTRVLWDLVGPEVQEEFKRLRSDVVQELNPSQRKTFEERSRRYRRERSTSRSSDMTASNAVSLPSPSPSKKDPNTDSP